MPSFNGYITENKVLEKHYSRVIANMEKKYIPEIKRKASKWLSMIKGCKDNALFRGVGLEQDFIRKDIRQDRQPLDTGESTHKIMDDAFLKYFGWKARSSGLFTSGRYNTAISFNDGVYAVFPIGSDIKYVYSQKYDDLNELDGRSEEDIEDVVENEFTDRNICIGIKSGSEIMIKAKSYIGLNVFQIEDYLMAKGDITERYMEESLKVRIFMDKYIFGKQSKRADIHKPSKTRNFKK